MIVLLTVLSGLLILMIQLGFYDGMTLIISENCSYKQLDHPAKVFPDHYPWEISMSSTNPTLKRWGGWPGSMGDGDTCAMCANSGLLSVHNNVHGLLGAQH